MWAERAYFCLTESICSLFSMVLCPVSPLTHGLESNAQSCSSPLEATFTGAAAKTASPHCLKINAPEAVLTDVAWLIKVWFLSPLSFLLVTENMVKISYFLASLCEPSEFRTHVWRSLCSKYGNGGLKSTVFFPYPPRNRLLGYEKQWSSLQ